MLLRHKEQKKKLLIETSGRYLVILIIWHRAQSQRHDIFKDFFRTLTSPPAPLHRWKRKWLWVPSGGFMGRRDPTSSLLRNQVTAQGGFL